MKRAFVVFVLALPLMAAKCSAPWQALCPPLKQYNEAFRVEFSREFSDVIGRYPHIAQVITDYGVTRDDIRDCMMRAKR